MSKRSNPHNFSSAIQLALLPEIVDDIESYLVEKAKLDEWLDGVGLEGYKVCTYYDPDREQWSASMMAYRTSNANNGHCIFGNAPTRQDALCLLYLKHSFCCADGNWGTSVTTASTDYS